MSDNIKVCKSCERALDLSAFGAKQARCKSCIAKARATAKAAATAAHTPDESALAPAEATAEATTPAPEPEPEPTPAPIVAAKNWDSATKPRTQLSADEQYTATVARAEVLQKLCDAGHGAIVGDNLSRAYARRSAIRCRECENARSREAKVAKRASSTTDQN